ncbi:hypothetical protein PInf_008284 [Phytophthora infestans]|nr:hypothetical protein PInf_008284 [Phytophthora infestans]
MKREASTSVSGTGRKKASEGADDASDQYLEAKAVPPKPKRSKKAALPAEAASIGEIAAPTRLEPGFFRPSEKFLRKAASGAKTRSEAAAGKAQAKSAKPHGKGSALQEATKVASEAIGSAGDAAVSKRASRRASKRRSPSPSVSPDDRPNPRFAEREFNSGS